MMKGEGQGKKDILVYKLDANTKCAAKAFQRQASI